MKDFGRKLEVIGREGRDVGFFGRAGRDLGIFGRDLEVSAEIL